MKSEFIWSLVRFDLEDLDAEEINGDFKKIMVEILENLVVREPIGKF